MIHYGEDTPTVRRAIQILKSGEILPLDIICQLTAEGVVVEDLEDKLDS